MRKTIPQDVLKFGQRLVVLLRMMILALAWVGGMALIAMMVVTCLDVLFRMVGQSFKGAYDIVRMTGLVAVGCALPYTTAIKGHVAVEFVHHRMGPIGRIIIDTFMRLTGMALFILLGAQCFQHGQAIRQSGQVSATLQWPIFWMPMLLGLSCFLTTAVIFVNLLHPGKEMLKP